MLKGKTVFISGGTGYIGSQICRSCSEYGASVIFSYNKDEKKANELLKKIKNSHALQINLKNISGLTTKINNLYTEIKRIDCLVNNAAISQIMPLAMLEEEDVDLVMDINIKGTIFLTKAIVKGMIRHKQGSTVNIGSIAGHRILDVPVTYAMSKSAMTGFTLSLTAELKRFKIRVNSVIPGLMEEGVSKGIPNELREEFMHHCATGRAGTAKEVAEVVCFLCSDKASYINGQNIFVDGGI